MGGGDRADDREAQAVPLAVAGALVAQLLATRLATSRESPVAGAGSSVLATVSPAAGREGSTSRVTPARSSGCRRSTGTGDRVIGPWQGLGVRALVSLLVGGVLLVRRDA